MYVHNEDNTRHTFTDSRGKSIFAVSSAAVDRGPEHQLYEGTDVRDDVDGKMFMLDQRFSGCFIVQFSKELNEDIKGCITYEGKEYLIHFKSFVDTDGNVMDPTDFSIKTAQKGHYDIAYAEHDFVAQQAQAKSTRDMQSDWSRLLQKVRFR